MKIETDTKLDFHNVLIRPKRSTINSRSEVDVTRSFHFPNVVMSDSDMHGSNKKKHWTGVPIISANMDTTGTFEVYDTLVKHGIITALNKFYTIEDFRRSCHTRQLDPDYFMVSTGITDENYNTMCTIVEETGCKWICIDIANGYIDKFVAYCRKVRERWPNKIIVAGNVATREMVEELILNGKVDVVKVGIGPGSACLTRLKTGVGMPQLSAVIECADAAHGVGGYIISDGGITCPGDMAKAFGGGADFVMMGGQFAGHDENPGELVERDGKKYKLFYGMSSQHAMEKHYGKMEKYRSSEGRRIEVKYRGPLMNTVLDYLGGVRSTCTYINAKCIKNMPKCTTFVQVTQQLNTHLI